MDVFKTMTKDLRQGPAVTDPCCDHVDAFRSVGTSARLAEHSACLDVAGLSDVPREFVRGKIDG